MALLKKTLRTCIFCRSKIEQKKMLRLKCHDKKLVQFDHNGRSFYICDDCIEEIEQSPIGQKDYKRLEKTLFRKCKNQDNYLEQLKEIITHVR